MDMTPTTETNGARGHKARGSRQTQVAGTQEGSKKLRSLHEEYAIAKYRAKEAGDRVKEIKDEVLELMESEGLDSLAVDIEYGNETRRCVTAVVERGKKLKSTLDPKED